MLERTRQLEVAREGVFPVQSEHGFSLLPVIGVAFQRHIDCRAGIEDALIQNGHLACVVIDGIVRTFGERHATGGYLHRALRHVVGSQRDDIGSTASELSHEQVFILLGNLFGHGFGRVVELGIGILLRGAGGHAFRHEIVVEVFAEGFHQGEEHASVGHGVTVNKVEISVRVWLHVIVQPVGSEQSDDGLVFYLRLGQIVEIDACRVALELHVQPEFLSLHAGCEVIDVLHHQVPVALCRIVAGVFQRFDEECLRHIGIVAGKLSDLEGLSAVGIFVGNGEHLVGLECGFQCDVAERCVHGVFRR